MPHNLFSSILETLLKYSFKNCRPFFYFLKQHYVNQNLNQPYKCKNFRWSPSYVEMKFFPANMLHFFKNNKQMILIGFPLQPPKLKFKGMQH